MLVYVSLPSSLAASCSRASLASRSAADAVRAAISRFGMIGPAIVSLEMHGIVDSRRRLAAERQDSESTMVSKSRLVGLRDGVKVQTRSIHATHTIWWGSLIRIYSRYYTNYDIISTQP